MAQYQSILALSLACALALPVQAQQQPGQRCQKINTTDTGTFDQTTFTAQGTTRSGPLKGSFAFTGDPTSIADVLSDIVQLQTSSSYAGTTVFTTSSGTLTANDVGVYEPGMGGRGVQLSRVASGTGTFSDATGYLVFSSSSTDGVHFTSTVTGQICRPTS